jgi:hypothetical protein
VLEWSWPAWLISLAAVAASGAVAALEGHWDLTRGLDVGFGTHGGMWGDALLLSAVNAIVVPWVEPGPWLAWSLAAGLAATVALHAWWHGGHGAGLREHMWPARPTGRWYADLSWAGWCHVAYVGFEVALLVAYVASPMPVSVVLAVSLLLSAHVPLGVLLPPWSGAGQVYREDVWQMVVAIGVIWAIAAAKMSGATGSG